MVPQVSDVVTTRRRPLLFLVAYFIAVILATAIFTYQRLSRYPFEIVWRDEMSEVFGHFLVTLFFLPGGLAGIVEWILNAFGIDFELLTSGPFPGPANALASLLIGLSYLTYFLLLLLGSVTTKQRTFRILYFAFIGLLIATIGGCSLMY